MRLDDTQMKTLKSQLRLRPSYNELIKEITKEEYKNMNIRDVIDRNAYYCRDSPLGTVYDNNTVDLRQQHFQKILEQPKTVPHFDMTKDDEMDDLRDGSIQTLSATMDDAEEHHERQISQVSKRLSSEQMADLHQRAQRARQLEEKDEWQSVVSSKSSNYDDLPPLEDLQPKRVSNLQKARVRFIDEDKDSPEPIEIKEAEKRREQKRDNADISSTLPPTKSIRHKETIDYSTAVTKWRGVSEQDLLFQLHLRGIELTESEEEEYNTASGKGKRPRRSGSYDLTQKQLLVAKVEDLINKTEN